MRYVFRCGCGEVDLEFGMGQAPLRFACPRCGLEARRVFVAPCFCVKRGSVYATEHLPETPAEKRYWKERAGVDVDRVMIQAGMDI